MSKKEYTEDDIKLTKLEDLLSRKPEMFFGSRGPNPEHITTAIAQGALILGANKIQIENKEGWYLICADVDWLKTPSIKEVNEISVFENIWAFPEAGQNWHRSEVMTRVYSEGAFSISGEEVYEIKPTIPPINTIKEMVSSFKEWSRIIGFKFKNYL
jgi:hypothetical protein